MNFECQSCKKPFDAVNHVPGCVFVGWGRGWDLCPTCKGSTYYTRVKVVFGSYGEGTVVSKAPDGFHSGKVCFVWLVRFDDGKEIQVEESVLEVIK